MAFQMTVIVEPHRMGRVEDLVNDVLKELPKVYSAIERRIKEEPRLAFSGLREFPAYVGEKVYDNGFAFHKAKLILDFTIDCDSENEVRDCYDVVRDLFCYPDWDACRRIFEWAIPDWSFCELKEVTYGI